MWIPPLKLNKDQITSQPAQAGTEHGDESWPSGFEPLGPRLRLVGDSLPWHEYEVWNQSSWTRSLRFRSSCQSNGRKESRIKRFDSKLSSFQHVHALRDGDLPFDIKGCPKLNINSGWSWPCCWWYPNAVFSWWNSLRNPCLLDTGALIGSSTGSPGILSSNVDVGNFWLRIHFWLCEHDWFHMNIYERWIHAKGIFRLFREIAKKSENSTLACWGVLCPILDASSRRSKFETECLLGELIHNVCPRQRRST